VRRAEETGWAKLVKDPSVTLVYSSKVGSKWARKRDQGEVIQGIE